MVWYGMIWYDTVWYGMVWFCLIWFDFGKVWFGLVWLGWFGLLMMVLMLSAPSLFLRLKVGCLLRDGRGGGGVLLILVWFDFGGIYAVYAVGVVQA